MKTYRAALIGAGGFAHNHIQAMQAAGERLAIEGVVDRDGNEAEAFRSRYGIARAFTDTATMLADVKPDFVQICTPPHSHVSISLMCLESGAHVLCEKPLCGSLADFDRLNEAARIHGRTISSVFQWRFGSAAQTAKRMLAAGMLGIPLISTCHTLWYRDADYYAVPWRSQRATALGGTTTGLGIHLMDLMLWLLPDWEEVQAVAAVLGRSVEVDTLSMAQVRFASGGFASIVNSALSPRQETHLRIDCERATLEVKELYSADNDAWTFTPAPDESIVWTVEGDQPGLLDAQVRATLDSLDRGEAPLVSGDEARRIIEFITCLYKSAATGQPVRRGAVTADDPFYHNWTGQT